MKADRNKILAKYDSRCSYCGCEITLKDMQIDHIVPKYRKGTDDESNLNPACRACNFYKQTFTIDEFREQIKTIIDRLSKSFIFRLALKYGIIEIKEKDILFYFEKLPKGRANWRKKMTVEKLYELSENDINAFYEYANRNHIEYLKLIVANVKKDFSNVEKYSSIAWTKTVLHTFNFSNAYYRIVPEPKPKRYKPYEKVNLEWVGKAIQSKATQNIFLIHSIYPMINSIGYNDVWDDLKQFFLKFTWYPSGLPCGEEVV